VFGGLPYREHEAKELRCYVIYNRSVIEGQMYRENIELKASLISLLRPRRRKKNPRLYSTS
jgi:hypothetical protein